MAGLIWKKLEMTRIVKDNQFIPITLIEIPTLKVIEIKTEQTHGYNSVKLWVLKKKKKGELTNGKKTLAPQDFSFLKEIDISKEDVEKYKVGDTVSLDSLEWIEEVRVVGTSKWKWFAGAMKRWNFHWGPKTHGSKFHRALGSIWNRKPTRTHKGKKMHGHMGDVRVTLKHRPLALVDKELNVIGVKWSIPGGRNSLLIVTY